MSLAIGGIYDRVNWYNLAVELLNQIFTSLDKKVDAPESSKPLNSLLLILKITYGLTSALLFEMVVALMAFSSIFCSLILVRKFLILLLFLLNILFLADLYSWIRYKDVYMNCANQANSIKCYANIDYMYISILCYFNKNVY